MVGRIFVDRNGSVCLVFDLAVVPFEWRWLVPRHLTEGMLTWCVTVCVFDLCRTCLTVALQRV